jgi:hypothetical protein
MITAKNHPLGYFLQSENFVTVLILFKYLSTFYSLCYRETLAELREKPVSKIIGGFLAKGR